MWNARKIIKDLADPERRRRILVAFWRFGDDTAKLIAIAQIAKALHFREESIRAMAISRSEEHTSELQSQSNLVCRLLLEKKKRRCSNITRRRCTNGSIAA